MATNWVAGAIQICGSAKWFLTETNMDIDDESILKKGAGVVCLCVCVSTITEREIRRHCHGALTYSC